MPKGNGSKTESVSISLESDFIAVLDYLAYTLDVSRSDLCRRFLKQGAALELSKPPSFWDRVYYGVQNESKQKKLF